MKTVSRYCNTIRNRARSLLDLLDFLRVSAQLFSDDCPRRGAWCDYRAELSSVAPPRPMCLRSSLGARKSRVAGANGDPLSSPVMGVWRLCFVAMSVMALSVGACGGDACEDADARFEECGLTESKNGAGECSSDEDECYAGCNADADCADLLGERPLSDDYVACIADCTE